MPSNIDNLKLGISQTELIANTKTHIDALYDANTEQNEAISAAQAKADDAYNLASQKHKIVAYDTLSAMISALNSANKDEFNIGDEIYIKDTTYTRDFWVSAKQDTPYTTQTDENGFNAGTFDKGYVSYFELSILDSRPEVTNMVTSDENITEDTIVLGADNTKKVKGSSYSIATTLDNSDRKVPTNSAVANAISNIGTETSPVDYATRAIQDANGKVISTTYATKDELANAGKVKSVSINGEPPVEPDADGNIDLTISVSGESEPLISTLTKVPNSELVNHKYYNGVNYVTYKAIRLNAKIVVTGIYNSNKVLIITQPVVVAENGTNYIYYLVAENTTEDYYYQTIDGEVVGGEGSIVDFSVLPSTTELKENIIYRVPRLTFYTPSKGKISSNDMICYVVKEVPSSGFPAVTFDNNLNPIRIETYYVPKDNVVLGYIDENLANIISSIGGTFGVGWHSVRDLFPLININYQGIIYATDHAVEDAYYLLVEYDLYSLKNGRFKLINVSERKSYNWENTHTFEKKAIFNNEVEFNSNSKAIFNGEVDFNGARVTGLQNGGGLTKTKVTLAELEALCTAENMGMMVSIICKNATLRDYNGVCAPMLKVGYSSLSTNAPEIFNRFIHSISDSYFNGQPVLQFTEYLLRITSAGVVFNRYFYRINKSTLEYTSGNETLKADLTDSNFDFYVYR